MNKIQRLFSIVFAIFLVFTVSSPAIAGGGPTKYTSDETRFIGFIGFIDFGQMVFNLNGTPQTIHAQKVLYAKVSSDNRLTGLDIVTFDAKFDIAGSGPSVGTRNIKVGTFVILTSSTCANGVNGCIVVSDYQGKSIYVVFTPAKNKCTWDGVFYTSLQVWGGVAPKSFAALAGTGGQCNDLIAKETAAYNQISGTIYKTH
jgi:hypothetical protein